MASGVFDVNQWHCKMVPFSLSLMVDESTEKLSDIRRGMLVPVRFFDSAIGRSSICGKCTQKRATACSLYRHDYCILAMANGNAFSTLTLTAAPTVMINDALLYYNRRHSVFCMLYSRRHSVFCKLYSMHHSVFCMLYSRHHSVFCMLYSRLHSVYSLCFTVGAILYALQ